MSRLRLLFGAVHLPIPAIGESPVLVALHGDQCVVPRLWVGTDTGHHRHVEISGNSLIRARETRVEGKLLRPGGQFLGGQRRAGLGVFLCRVVRAGLLLQVHVVRMRQSAAVIWIPKWVAVAQRRTGWSLRRGALAAGVRRRNIRVDGALVGRDGARMSSQSGVRHQFPAVGRRAIAAQSLHCLAFTLAVFIRAFFINVHQGVRPAWMQNQRSRHIRGCRCFLKVDYSKTDTSFPTTFYTRRMRTRGPSCVHFIRNLARDTLTSPARLGLWVEAEQPFKDPLPRMSPFSAAQCRLLYLP